MGPRRRKREWPLGTRGSAGSGPHIGLQLLVDSVGMTPVDPLAVLVSPDLSKDHPDEIIVWVNPEDIDSALRSWNVVWGDKDEAVAARLQSLI